MSGGGERKNFSALTTPVRGIAENTTFRDIPRSGGREQQQPTIDSTGGQLPRATQRWILATKHPPAGFKF